MLATPLCQHCMCVSHRENAFHCIEQWNGSFFGPANLPEVGTYLLVQHHVGEPMCHMLGQWSALLNDMEVAKDNAEQDRLCGVSELPAPALALTEAWTASKFEFQSSNHGDSEVENKIADEEEDSDSEELHDIAAINSYFAVDGDHNISMGVWLSRHACTAIPDNYIRVVHSNGVHYIPLVSCHCRNVDGPHLDLFAAQLLPTSFERIKTLFSAQVLDLFQLSNLKLKAWAYQFYQLLH